MHKALRIVIAVALASVTNSFLSAEEIPALRDVFADRFITGVAIDEREISGASAELLTRHFGAITAEKHMKPGAIQPEEGRFTFDDADKLVKFAKDHDLQIYGHVMIWHGNTPDWFFTHPDGTPLTSSYKDREIARARMKTHIEALARRYGNDIWAWEVVNEAIDPTTDDGMRHSRWYEILGPNYVAHAFRYARAALPADVKLFINDHGTQHPDRRRAYVKLVESLLADDVPIDGVGHQFHVKINLPISQMKDAIKAFRSEAIKALRPRGLIQAVTELDMAISHSDDEKLTNSLRKERITAQGDFAKDLVEMLYQHHDVIASVSFWGLHDGRTWLKHWHGGRPLEAPLLFDEDLKAKDAFWGMVDPSRLSD